GWASAVRHSPAVKRPTLAGSKACPSGKVLPRQRPGKNLPTRTAPPVGFPRMPRISLNGVRHRHAFEDHGTANAAHGTEAEQGLEYSGRWTHDWHETDNAPPRRGAAGDGDSAGRLLL